MVQLNSAGALLAPEARAQFIRFVAVGLANTVFSYGLYLAGLGIGLPYYLAIFLALCGGVVVGFITQGRLVFRSQLKGKFALFVGLWATLYFANLTAIRVFNAAGLPYSLAGLAALPPITLLSYLLQRKVVFAADRPPLLQLVLGTLTFACLLIRINLQVGFEIHWDEFLNLSMVHDYLRGTLQNPLQTFFVHLFTWLPAVSSNEVDQVLAARALILPFAIATSLAIYGTARRFLPIEAALVAVVAFNSFSFVMRHAGSLRTDVLATATMMVGVWLASAERFRAREAIAIGALVGVSGAFTIKAVFFVPVIATLLVLRVLYGERRVKEAGLVLAAGVTALLVFGAIQALHTASLINPGSSVAFVNRTSGSTLASSDFATRIQYIREGAVSNPLYILLLAIGLGAAILQVKDPHTRKQGIAFLSLSFVLLSVLFYRDTYPYYFVMLLAPASVLVGLGFEVVRQRRELYALVLAACLALSTGVVFLASMAQGFEAQRQTLALVHRLFPTPVHYIDGRSMVSTYPKSGFFMSAWGMTDYRAAGEPVMRRLISKDQPQFLLATGWQLDVDELDPTASARRRYGLMAEDVRALKASYVRYWGPLYVPGIRFAGGRNQSEVLIEAPYQVLSPGPVLIDGARLEPGQTVRLPQGVHSIMATAPGQLRRELPPPPTDTPPRQLFRGF